MIGFACEEWDECIDDVKELSKKLYKEVGYLRQKHVLDPDYELDERMVKNKMAVFFTMRDDDILVGFSLYFFSNLQYYKDCKVAKSDLLYIDRDYRGELAKEFIQSNETALREIGMDVIQIQVMKEKDFSPMLESLGYDSAAIVCSKYIGDS